MKLLTLILHRLAERFDAWSHKRRWEYGACRGLKARRNRHTGEVQFVLWKAGERGHVEDYWHNFNSYWWPVFTAIDQFKAESDENTETRS